MGASSQFQRPEATRDATPVNPAILNSWKEIARYLGRGVRTVQRWEYQFGMPVHRPAGKDRSAVLALASELDRWLQRTPIQSGGNGSADEAAPTPEIGAVLLDLARDLLVQGEHLVEMDQQRRPEAERLLQNLREVERELTEINRIDSGTKFPRAV